MNENKLYLENNEDLVIINGNNVIISDCKDYMKVLQKLEKLERLYNEYGNTDISKMNDKEVEKLQEEADLLYLYLLGYDKYFNENFSIDFSKIFQLN